MTQIDIPNTPPQQDYSINTYTQESAETMMNEVSSTSKIEPFDEVKNIYNELNSRYGYIPYSKINTHHDFIDYIRQCQKADLVKMLGLSMMNKMETRIKDNPNKNLPFLQQLNKPIQRATVGGFSSKFVNDYMKYLNL